MAYSMHNWSSSTVRDSGPQQYPQGEIAKGLDPAEARIACLAVKDTIVDMMFALPKELKDPACRYGIVKLVEKIVVKLDWFEMVK